MMTMQSIPIKPVAIACCESQQLVERNGTVVCMNCGSVVDKCFDQSGFVIVGSERYENNFAKQHVALGKRPDNTQVCGSYIDFYKAGYFHDAHDAPLSPDKQKLYYRLKFTRDFRSRLDDNETRIRILQILKDVTDHLSLVPDIKMRAAYMYAKIVKHDKPKVINHVTLIASCLVMAIKESHAIAPVTMKEVCDAFKAFHHRVKPGLITRDSLLYKRFSSAKVKRNCATTYIPRQLSMLANDEAFKAYYRCKDKWLPAESYITWMQRSVANLIKALPTNIHKNPYNLTAALLYLADQVRAKRFGRKRVLTQRILANAVHVAEYTIRDVYCFLKDRLTERMWESCPVVELPKQIAIPAIVAAPVPTPVVSKRQMVCKVCGEIVSKAFGCRRCIVESPS